MGVLKIRVEPVIVGPLGDGAAQRMAEEWAQLTSQALGDAAADMLRNWKFAGGKAGAGRDSRGRFTHREGASRSGGGFASQIHVMRRSRSETEVRGPMVRGVAWATWLEGTSQRNQSTGFKGYHLFRTTRAAVQQMAPQVGRQVLDELMPEIGGA